MNLAIFTQNYPTEDNLYNSSFVHTRVRGYIRAGQKVIVYRLADKPGDYTFANVKVVMGDEEHIRKAIMSNMPDAICAHMPNMREIKLIKTLPVKNVSLWFHGNESVWSCYHYPYDGIYPARFLKFLYRFYIDLKKRKVLGGYMLEYKPKIVHLGEVWRSYTNRFMPVSKIHYRIIPNPIDDAIFKYKQRNGLVKNIICVRSHDTRKYGLDIIIKLFRNSRYCVDIYGTGKLLEYHKRLAKKYNSNVRFITKFYTHEELNVLYHKYNLGIMMTRLDAQGVSACEMMSTGLPLITSDIEGNSEFTEKGCIRIPNDTNIDIDEIIDKINNKSTIMKMSKDAYEYIDKKLNMKKIIREDLAWIKE